MTVFNKKNPNMTRTIEIVESWINRFFVPLLTYGLTITVSLIGSLVQVTALVEDAPTTTSVISYLACRFFTISDTSRLIYIIAMLVNFRRAQKSHLTSAALGHLLSLTSKVNSKQPACI